MEIIYFHVLLSALALVFSEGYEVPEESVMEELFYEYNNEARPASVRQPVVKVSHQLTLTRIISLREELLVIDTWQVISWKDLRLVWDRAYYDDVETINVDPSKIWKPDIVNFDNAGGNSGLIYNNLPLTVKYNGDIVYVPPTRLTTQCQPYGDVYHCIWTFGSWTYDIKKLDINNTYGAIDMSEYNVNSRIAIIDSSVRRTLKKYANFPNRYAILTYNITIRWKDADRFEGLEPLQMPPGVSKKSELQNDEHIPVGETVFESILVNATAQSDADKGEGGSEGDGDTPTEEEQSSNDEEPTDYWDTDNTDYDDTTTESSQGQETETSPNEETTESSQEKENTESSPKVDATDSSQEEEIVNSDKIVNPKESTPKEEIVNSAKIVNPTESTQKAEIVKSVQTGNTTESTQNDDAVSGPKITENTDKTENGNDEVEPEESETDSGEGDTDIGAWQRIKSIWSK